MKQMTFNQISQSAGYAKDDVAVSITVCGGSYGGGSEVLVLESNQNHATIKDTEICPTLPASMGLGGGYVPMIIAEEIMCEEENACDNPNSLGFTRKSDN